MIWVIVFVGIGLAGLIMLISYAIWLAHKASDLFSEIDMMAVRAGELADLLGQIRVPEPPLLPEVRTVAASDLDIAQASAT